MKKYLLFVMAIVIGVGLAACEEEDIRTRTPYVPGVKGDFYFEGSFNGGLVLLSEGQNNYISTASTSSAIGKDGCWQTQDIMLTKKTSSVNSLRISFIKKFEACPKFCQELEAMLQKGKYVFGKTAAVTGKDPVEGVVITFIDSEGTVWASDKGAARQQGSVFLVDAMSDNTHDTTTAMITEAQFNCILYDGAGNEVRLTNGEIKSRSVDCSQL